MHGKDTQKRHGKIHRKKTWKKRHGKKDMEKKTWKKTRKKDTENFNFQKTRKSNKKCVIQVQLVKHGIESFVRREKRGWFV